MNGSGCGQRRLRVAVGAASPSQEPARDTHCVPCSQHGLGWSRILKGSRVPPEKSLSQILLPNPGQHSPPSAPRVRLHWILPQSVTFPTPIPPASREAWEVAARAATPINRAPPAVGEKSKEAEDQAHLQAHLLAHLLQEPLLSTPRLCSPPLPSLLLTEPLKLTPWPQVST